jgi:pimeloyl-ACP methyl ester carboxylesterase
MVKPMSKSTNRVRSGFLSLLLIGAGVFYIQRAFRAEKRQTLAWLRSTSQVITTERGVIEYAVRGQGTPLLFFHGGMGGYEQGLALAEMLALDDFKLITFSRPGYRRTDIEIGGSLPEQAEAVCKVLDHLGLER